MSIYTKDMPNVINDEHSIIGDYTYGPISIERAYDGSASKFTMGKFGSIGQGVRAVYFGSHQLYEASTYPFAHLHGKWPHVHSEPVNGQDIIIGNDVYLANNCIIMQGARIDDGAVIGAFSVIKGHVKPYSIVAGNPAREIRKRFNEDKINKLLEISWWNWDIKDINKHLQMISSSKVDDLYNIYLKEIKHKNNT